MNANDYKTSHSLRVSFACRTFGGDLFQSCDPIIIPEEDVNNGSSLAVFMAQRTNRTGYVVSDITKTLLEQSLQSIINPEAKPSLPIKKVVIPSPKNRGLELKEQSSSRLISPLKSEEIPLDHCYIHNLDQLQINETRKILPRQLRDERKPRAQSFTVKSRKSKVQPRSFSCTYEQNEVQSVIAWDYSHSSGRSSLVKQTKTIKRSKQIRSNSIDTCTGMINPQLAGMVQKTTDRELIGQCFFAA